MKPKKKKIDIKAFLIDNVEKIVLALVIPLAFFFAWQGTRFTLLKWTPEELTKIANEADFKIKGSQRGSADEGVTVTDYDKTAEWISADIYPDLYATNTKWMPSLFPEKSKREAVEVFTVEELRASSGLGAMRVAFTSPQAASVGARRGIPPGTTRIGQRWAVITGLIPYKKQSDHFIDTFASAPVEERDTPQYRWYVVERAEVPLGTDLNLIDPEDWENFEWTKLDINEAMRNTVIWDKSGAGGGNTVSFDPVDVTHQVPIPSELSIPMAHELPPVGRPFGAEVAHPKIPMLTEEQALAIQEQKQLVEKHMAQFMETDLETKIITDDPFKQQTAGNEGIIEKKREPYCLFRFFDFTVESGKTYCYRVRLHITDPNHGLDPRLLDDRLAEQQELLKEKGQEKKGTVLITASSKPSNPITIPLGSRVLVSSTSTNEQSPWLEPQAGISLIYFDMEDGTEWYYDRDRVYRGQTLNYRGDGIGPPKT